MSAEDLVLVYINDDKSSVLVKNESDLFAELNNLRETVSILEYRLKESEKLHDELVEKLKRGERCEVPTMTTKGKDQEHQSIQTDVDKTAVDKTAVDKTADDGKRQKKFKKKTN